MSIWDAFKGVPDPKPQKPKPVSSASSANVDAEKTPAVNVTKSKTNSVENIECPCCHKIHNPKNISSSKEGSARRELVACQKDGTKPNLFSNHDEETYSAEDDKKIVQLKKENTPWKKILEAIGKESASQLKEHWKKINPDNADLNGGKAEDKRDSGQTHTKDKATSDSGTKGSDAPEKSKKGEGNKKQKEASKKNDKRSGEDNNLKRWADRYDRQKWMVAASRHFDLTGERITPEKARKLAEEK